MGQWQGVAGPSPPGGPARAWGAGGVASAQGGLCSLSVPLRGAACALACVCAVAQRGRLVARRVVALTAALTAALTGLLGALPRATCLLPPRARPLTLSLLHSAVPQPYLCQAFTPYNHPATVAVPDLAGGGAARRWVTNPGSRLSFVFSCRRNAQGGERPLPAGIPSCMVIAPRFAADAALQLEREPDKSLPNAHACPRTRSLQWRALDRAHPAAAAASRSLC